MKYHLLYTCIGGQFKIVETGKTIPSNGYGEVIFSSDNLETVTACVIFCTGYISAYISALHINPELEVLNYIANNHFVLSYSKLKSSVFLDNL